MKNPFLITLDDNSHVEIGDPFILRFNGKYYLYCSTCDDLEGIRCFISDDLINFKYYGVIASSPLLKHAYAPEVIYKDDEFIMATSPRGNGHYFLKSKSPLGPFEFISGNLNNMIDGSFINDKNNNLHFLRADHNGIAYLDYKNNKLVNRKDILPQVSKAWTEGPSIIYHNGYYYATYCGNDVLSDNYRIKIASSKFIDKDYKTQDSPLLLATEKDFYALGHNSLVLGPSLNEYFVCYHTLKRLEKGTTRYMCLDRLYLNKDDATCNYSYFEIDNPKRPDFECDLSVENKLNRVNNFILNDEDLDLFTSEFNFKNETSIIVSYIDEFNYKRIEFKGNYLSIYEMINGNEKTLLLKKMKFNFNHFHVVRLVNDKSLELLIDNIPILKLKKLNKGRIGYIYKELDLYYVCYTKGNYLSNLKNDKVILTNKISCINFDKCIDNKSLKLNKGEKTFVNVTNYERKRYLLYLKMKNKDVTLKVSSSIESKIVNIKKNDNAYDFSNRYIIDLEIDNLDKLEIEVLKGNLEFVYLNIYSDIYKDSINLAEIKKNKEQYLFNKFSRKQSLFFKLNRRNVDSLYGLIINANNYCDFRSVKNIKYHGYFVGFENGLLVVDYCQYDRVRIYDKPYRLNTNQEYKLSVEYLDNKINVYINDKLEITTDIKYDTCYGKTGIYKNKYSYIKILDYKEDE